MESLTNTSHYYSRPLNKTKATQWAKPIVSIKNLELSYKNHKVFSHVNFDIPERAITCLVGPSGSGKTSLLFSLNRMTDFNSKVLVRGQICFEQQNILTCKNTHWLRKNIGLVFQKPNPFPLSIYKNLDIPLRDNSDLNKKQRREKIIETFQAVGLWDEVKDRLHFPAHLLSGGQQQRLCIARCLVLNPKIILMDEPTSSLDPMAESKIEELLDRLKKNYSILLVTHKMKQMRRVSDKVVVFWPKENKTELIAQGHYKDIIDQQKSGSFLTNYLLE